MLSLPFPAAIDPPTSEEIFVFHAREDGDSISNIGEGFIG